jgi:hypothetical protein
MQNALAGAALALGSPHALGAEATPERRTPLPGSVFGRVWSCLVRSTSLLFAGLLRRLDRVSGITAPVLTLLVPVHDELLLHLVVIIPT